MVGRNWNLYLRLAVIVGILLFLEGCATQHIGSEKGGECRIAHTPVYAVLGKTTYDQEWIDDTEEALVRGCQQPRPKARPASLDARPLVITPKTPAAPLPVAKPKKKHWWQRASND